MVAHVLRLRLDLLLGSLRAGGGRAGRMVVGFAILAVATAAVCWALLTLRDDTADVAHTVTVLLGSSLALAALLGPFVGGIEDQLDPRRFSIFGMDANALAGTLVLGALVSIPSVALFVVSATIAVLWTSRGVPGWIAWPNALIGFVTVVLLARVSMALSSLLMRARRSREMSGLFVLGLIVVVVPVAVFLGSLRWGGVVPQQLRGIVQFLQATPFGAAWGVPGATHTHGSARWLFLVGLVTLLAVFAAWVLLVRTLLTTTERPPRGRTGSGAGWFAVLPGTASGAVAARSLVYWLRDRRYIANFIVVPVAAIVLTIPPLVAGVPLPIVALFIPVPIMALFFGWMPHNDIAYDSTAIWLHVVSGVRGIADRVGRLVPILLIAVPVLAVAIPICIALYGRWAMLPALVGVAANLFLAGLGLSSVASIVSPYPATRPGDSAFSQPQRSSSGFGAQAVTLLGAIVLSVPSIWLAWRALADVSFAVGAMWVGIGMGAGVLAIGLALGAWLFERRGSRIMEFAEAI